MKTSTSEGTNGIQWTARMQLDDMTSQMIWLFYRTRNNKFRRSRPATSVAVVPNIHRGKARFSYITCSTPTLEDKNSSTFLNCIIDKQEESDADVNLRIDNARTAFPQFKYI
ncbi:unnamed protein product [Schistosoma margrebowiei]|uniref:Uncharacterized protein n=1 Tax=Schistosoma margrebowiei TaxID=48269 RepID=A0A183M4F1_9TREM|nr:unnamed protein product [Schistosoma margrebowiei]